MNQISTSQDNRIMLCFGLRKESAGDRGIMEEPIIVQIKNNMLFLPFFFSLSLFYNTSVCIRKGWIVSKWSNFSNGMETPKVFIPSGNVDTQPWLLSTFVNFVNQITRIK